MFLMFLFLLAPDPGRLAFQASQIEQLGPSHFSAADHIDSINSGRMHGKDSLHPDPIGDLPHCESGLDPSGLLPDDHSLEWLYSLLLTLDDLHMDPDRIPHPEGGEIRPQLFPFN